MKAVEENQLAKYKGLMLLAKVRVVKQSKAVEAYQWAVFSTGDTVLGDKDSNEYQHVWFNGVLADLEHGLSDDIADTGRNAANHAVKNDSVETLVDKWFWSFVRDMGKNPRPWMFDEIDEDRASHQESFEQMLSCYHDVLENHLKQYAAEYQSEMQKLLTHIPKKLRKLVLGSTHATENAMPKHKTIEQVSESLDGVFRVVQTINSNVKSLVGSRDDGLAKATKAKKLNQSQRSEEILKEYEIMLGAKSNEGKTVQYYAEEISKRLKNRHPKAGGYSASSVRRVISKK